DHQKRSDLFVICYFCHAASNLCGNAKLAGNELLPTVDVVGRAREGGVGHDVYGERCDVGRSDDAPDGKRGAKLIAAVFEFIAEERCRQRCVDEAGGDEVDSDGRELERQVGREGGECRSRKKRSRGAGSVASKAAVLSASSSLAARWRRSGFLPVRIKFAPSARARRAVSSPMPALPPITTTVCPRSSGSRSNLRF